MAKVKNKRVIGEDSFVWHVSLYGGDYDSAWVGDLVTVHPDALVNLLESEEFRGKAAFVKESPPALMRLNQVAGISQLPPAKAGGLRFRLREA
jgi:hypothetical protein